MRWKKGLEGMAPYKPGRSIEEVKRQYGLEEVVKLASNENPYGFSPNVNTVHVRELQIYPDGYATGLRAKVAAKLDILESQLLFGAGSDEIIMIITRALLGPGTNAIMATPTFPQYAHNAKVEGAEVREIPLVNGAHDLEAMKAAIDENTRVIWLCSPNNPTGGLTPSQAIKDFIEQIPEDILVAIDEAYYEYITDPSYIDSATLAKTYPNLIVLRTFSKAYGLAALRVGYAFGAEPIITYLNTVRSPFNLTTASMKMAEAAFDDEDFIQTCRDRNANERERFRAYAESRNIFMYPSEANFVLLEVPGDADEATNHLLMNGFIVRSGNALGTPQAIRVTIGTPDQNTRFFEAFDAMLTELEK